ncbi:hypothetical protein PS858_04517 [Pseudomonas fluorescens]|jgi:hypothetical protein|uniref:hypothetical protein n=1 Tax=Pseudomonas fluorescens TaxID=294 RepID=UPI0012416BAC|nr:hypothetical protein [Pseudomonas fluorescens]VVN19152.1 hypothetical protein PS676_04209 [Pseudomonas fluorescens]VVP34865.1 hypothetical protein PS858_04517 [Pseudomonas fluorescens]
MSNILLKEVSARLGEVFKETGFSINVDETYLTSVVINDQGEQVVDYSQSLSWAIMEKVQANELPRFNDTSAGIFFKQWTFDKAYRDPEVDIEQLNVNGRFVVQSFSNN